MGEKKLFLVPKCSICNGEGWVCENHSGKAWEYGNATCCKGAGMPCVCNKSDPPWDHIKPIILRPDSAEEK